MPGSVAAIVLVAPRMIRRRRLPRETEVENLHLAVVEQEDVLGLEVAMDQTFGVGSAEAARDLDGDVDGFPRGQSVMTQCG